MARFFHSLVVLGAGMTGCGGITNVASGGSSGTGDGAGGGRPGAGSGGAPASGGALEVGGSPLRGTGGSPFGATGGAGTGGFLGDGGSVGAGAAPSLPDPGTLAQWNCTAVFSGCDYSMPGFTVPYRLIGQCPVDPTKPRSPADCAANEWFECRDASYFGGPRVLVDCVCTPMLDGGCDNCVPLGPGISFGSCSGHTKTCGCAIAVITH